MTRSLLAIALAAALGGACGRSTPTSSACAEPLMIDDMEDGDRFICESGGRHGDWYVVDDGTSTKISPRGEFTHTLIPGGRGASRTAARMTGYDFTEWGAAMGFSLNGEGAAAQPYDASAAGGVRFWMKSNVSVVVSVPIPETTATGAAAGCVDDGPNWNCDNHFQFRITAPTPGVWTEYDVPFAALAQLHLLGPDGNTLAGSAVWDPSRVVGVQLSVDALQTFDVWIDDVRFYACSSSTCLPTCNDPALPVACPATGASPASCQPAPTICGKTPPADLLGVWGTASDDVWITGHRGTILHFAGFQSGSGWSAVPSGTIESLSLAWGSRRDDVWIVGVNGTILRWNGSAWSPVASGTTQPLYGVWGSGPNDVWAVGGGGTILRWDGATWSPVASGTSYTLWRVWGSGPVDVWAVGHAPNTSAGIIVHWDGAGWSPVPDAAPTAASAVGGTGANDVWVVGADGGIVHWNGVVWTAVPSGTGEFLRGVWAGGPADVWVVGMNGILHWNGSAWSTAPAPAWNFLSVWSSGPSDAWAVGGGATVVHFNGNIWTPVPVVVR